MNEKYNTPNSGCCGRPFQYAPSKKCGGNHCCFNEYDYKMNACIRRGAPSCDAQAVIPTVTVENASDFSNYTNCFIHVTSNNTTYYVDDKGTPIITWGGPVNIPGYDMEDNPNNYRDQIVTDTEAQIAVIYDRNGIGYTFGIQQGADVTDAVNAKLDEMAQDGTLENIIASYIEDVAHVFDTVADMKAADLVNGDYAKTIGYYTANDRGGAMYKITNATTSNNHYETLLSGLSAELILGGSLDILQLGAINDGVTDNTDIYNEAVSIASAKNMTLLVPKGVYKINGQVNFRSINLLCEGTLVNDTSIILGANSNGSTVTDTRIYKCNDVQIIGAKNSYFNIQHAGNIVLFADGNMSNAGSIAYNKIEGIDCSSITINGVNNGWINENEFNIKRCLGDLTITGDGTYSHNNNRFNNVCIEGSSKHITVDYGHSNYISYRGEGNPTVTLSQDPAQCFGNEIKRQEASVYGNVFTSLLFNANTTFNQVGMSAIPNYKSIRILDLNLSNVKNIDNNLIINDDGVISGGWANEYLNSYINPTMPFVISLFSDGKNQRIYISCYDAEGNIVDGNIKGAGVTKDPNTNTYRVTADVDNVVVSYAPTVGVARVEVKITSGSNTNKFTYAIADVYTPFMNMSNFNNTISTIKKTRSSSPATWTALNPTWEVGDIIYNSTPTPGGVYAWVCTTAGTGSASVWKTISISA